MNPSVWFCTECLTLKFTLKHAESFINHQLFFLNPETTKTNHRRETPVIQDSVAKLCTMWLLWGGTGPSATIFPTMSSEARPVCECLWAVRALVGWNIVMCVHVVSEVFFDGKPFPTHTAPVQSFLQVNSQHMPFATTLCRKGSTAQVTKQYLGVCWNNSTKWDAAILSHCWINRLRFILDYWCPRLQVYILKAQGCVIVGVKKAFSGWRNVEQSPCLPILCRCSTPIQNCKHRRILDDHSKDWRRARSQKNAMPSTHTQDLSVMRMFLRVMCVCVNMCARAHA